MTILADIITLWLMCASYMIRQKNKPELYSDLRNDDFEQYTDALIVPHRNAPVYLVAKGAPILKSMRFSLIPSWSKDEKPKFATHNARLESIDTKPAWRESFKKRHCVVPLTHFIEPIYKGEFGGHMVAFHAEDQGYLYAAGLWDEWLNLASGEMIASFTIITHAPPPFIEGIGHDRCPVFLKSQHAEQWLTLSESPPAMVNYLRTHQRQDGFAVEKHRPLKHKPKV